MEFLCKKIIIINHGPGHVQRIGANPPVNPRENPIPLLPCQVIIKPPSGNLTSSPHLPELPPYSPVSLRLSLSLSLSLRCTITLLFEQKSKPALSLSKCIVRYSQQRPRRQFQKLSSFQCSRKVLFRLIASIQLCIYIYRNFDFFFLLRMVSVLFVPVQAVIFGNYYLRMLQQCRFRTVPLS